MIWRLMASVMVMTTPGGVSVSTDHTDWPNQATCEQVLHDIYTTPPPQMIDGRRVTMKISALCMPVEQSPVMSRQQEYGSNYVVVPGAPATPPPPPPQRFYR